MRPAAVTTFGDRLFVGTNKWGFDWTPNIGNTVDIFEFEQAATDTSEQLEHVQQQGGKQYLRQVDQFGTTPIITAAITITTCHIYIAWHSRV